jgi:tRNA-dihydrouridine synthase
MWTEFVSADGLFKGGYEVLIKDLAFTEAERPIVAQFFSSSPEMMEKAGKLALELGFDGVDINMGCPDKSVEKQGAGAALIKNPKLAQEIILATKKGSGELPVSVKTRLGYNKDELETWLPALLEVEPAVITIHSRTRKEMSLVPARWERVKRAVEIRDESRKETLIFGNGDVFDLKDALLKAEETGCDGVMLGRAIFGNPWLFTNLKNKSESNREKIKSRGLFKNNDGAVNNYWNDYGNNDRYGDKYDDTLILNTKKSYLQTRECRDEFIDGVPIPEKLMVMVEHAKLFEKLLHHKSFAIMKKNFKAYATGFDGAKELRMKLMETENSRQVEEIVLDYLTTN